MRVLPAAMLLAALLAPPVAAAPTCRPVLSDPAHDTYKSSTVVGYDEPGADVLALHLASDAKNLAVMVDIADVDAPILTAPGGRVIHVLFRIGEMTFRASQASTLDTTEAYLAITTLWEEAGDESASAWAFSTKKVANVEFSIDVKRNRVRMVVPLDLMRKHTGGVRNGAPVRVLDVSTFDVQGTSYLYTGGTIDTTMPEKATWTLGARSCAR